VTTVRLFSPIFSFLSFLRRFYVYILSERLSPLCGAALATYIFQTCFFLDFPVRFHPSSPLVAPPRLLLLAWSLSLYLWVSNILSALQHAALTVLHAFFSVSAPLPVKFFFSEFLSSFFLLTCRPFLWLCAREGPWPRLTKFPRSLLVWAPVPRNLPLASFEARNGIFKNYISPSCWNSLFISFLFRLIYVCLRFSSFFSTWRALLPTLPSFDFKFLEKK